MRIIIIALIVVIMLVGCNASNQHNTKVNTNSLHNSLASGKVLELEDGTIYFTTKESDVLYLWHYDEKLELINKQEIECGVTNSCFYYLNVIGDKLYGYDHSARKLYCVDLDNDAEKLKSEVILDHQKIAGFLVQHIFVSDNRIYEFSYSDQDTSMVYSYNLKGNDQKEEGYLIEDDSFVMKEKLYKSSYNGL
ncbi:MAG: hypothetical protein PF505_02165, partial [Vallitaleaceae bacterium]|nr:hypothetical protein [Vallitaleaceae bacterium]